ncbi:MAG: NAD(P)/FAD-dependent oxidoreductase [Bacteriovoracaceae bacterium]|nr:NAD(P)/FAD-dependent oxidoreductase [Bacteriovoracaceae bacterium]
MYDAVIVGAGMSGLAAGIRLAMFDKKVCIFEKHSIPGGLNSYYRRRREPLEERKFDVGLHAMTNFIRKGEKGKPFSKLLKQLRLDYDSFQLEEQSHSKIQFPDAILKFSNDFELLKSEVARFFPDDYQNFLHLVETIVQFNELDLNATYQSTKELLSQRIKNPQLVEMIMCPLLIYGSAWENDMDFSQFVIMFKSIFLEGFARPRGGVRTILELLTKKFLEVGGEIKYRTPVEKIIVENKKIKGVQTPNGFVESKQVFSSMGLPETYERVSEGVRLPMAPAGPLSFTETILFYDKKVPLEQFDSTIVFYNNASQYRYQRPSSLYDNTSAVFCAPDNYHPNQRDGEGVLRITYMANYNLWKSLEREVYLQKKQEVLADSIKLVNTLIPDFDGNVTFSDVFSPTTIERYTWHKAGAVYGSTEKSRAGKTPIENLFIIGTDQGFVGIVGSILSGISISNLYGLMGES